MLFWGVCENELEVSKVLNSILYLLMLHLMYFKRSISFIMMSSCTNTVTGISGQGVKWFDEYGILWEGRCL